MLFVNWVKVESKPSLAAGGIKLKWCVQIQQHSSLIAVFSNFEHWLCNLSLFKVVIMCLMITAMARSLLAARPFWLVTTWCPQHGDSPGRWQTNTAELGDKHQWARGQAARTWQPPSSERGVAVTFGLFVSKNTGLSPATLLFDVRSGFLWILLWVTACNGESF